MLAVDSNAFSALRSIRVVVVYVVCVSRGLSWSTASSVWITYWITDYLCACLYTAVYILPFPRWCTSVARTVAKAATKAIKMTLGSRFIHFHVIHSCIRSENGPTRVKTCRQPNIHDCVPCTFSGVTLSMFVTTPTKVFGRASRRRHSSDV